MEQDPDNVTCPECGEEGEELHVEYTCMNSDCDVGDFFPDGYVVWRHD